MRIIAVVGPTAVGKSAYAVNLARQIGGEVVSADSRQVYKGLDIGTGKVTEAEKGGIPHHCLDVAEPKEQYSVFDFVQDASQAIEMIAQEGKTPIVCGGTGLYVDTLLGRRSIHPAKPNIELRARLEALPLAALQTELQALDPERYATVDIKNPRRLIRAIEIASAPPSNQQLSTPDYQVEWVGLTAPLPVLKTRIVERLHAHLAAGMLSEAKCLHLGGLDYKRMDELGLEYRYMARHLAGMLSYDEMVAALELEIYKYAKRQLTWFRANKEIQWIDVSSTPEPTL